MWCHMITMTLLQPYLVNLMVIDLLMILIVSCLIIVIVDCAVVYNS